MSCSQTTIDFLYRMLFADPIYLDTSKENSSVSGISMAILYLAPNFVLKIETAPIYSNELERGIII